MTYDKINKTDNSFLGTSKAWSIWFIAGLFYLFEFMHRVAPAVMASEWRHDFAVSAAALGSISAYYYYSYAFMQIPVGLLLDRYKTRKLLSFAALMIAIGSLIFAYTSSLFWANFARALIGFGSAFSFVGCLKLGAMWFSPRRFALIVGLTNFLGVSGAILAGRPLAHAVEHWDWRTTMYASCITSLIFVFLLYLFIRDRIGPKLKSSIDQDRFKQNLGRVLRHRQVWFTAIFASLMVAPIAMYAELWGISYLKVKNCLPRAMAAQIVTLIFVGIALGGPFWGWLSHYLTHRKIILAIGAFGAFCSVCVILYFNCQSAAWASFYHLLFGFFSSSMLLCFALNSEWMPKAQGTTIGFTNTIVMAGSALFQPLVGKILDSFPQESTSLLPFTPEQYQIALSAMPCCLLLALLSLFIIKTPHQKNEGKS